MMSTIEEFVRTVRRTLHRHPELSGKERRSSAYLQGILDERGWEIAPIPHTTSFLAYKTGRLPYTVGFRAELDALPIHEVGSEQTREYASETPGVMHACGHDMHAALAIGLALERDAAEGEGYPNLLLVFESSEEVLPGGAQAILASEAFAAHRPDLMLAFHCDPDWAVGTLGIRGGQYMASGDELWVTVHGKAAHGGLPHTGVDTLLVAAHILVALQSVVARNVPSAESVVLSFGHVACEGRMNLIPAKVRLEGTLRTQSETWRREAKERIAAIVQHTAAAFGATASLEIREGYPPLCNDQRLAERAAQLLTQHGDRVEPLGLRMTTDDFAYFAQRFPSLFLRLGVGRTGNLHSGEFCPDEGALAHGLSVLPLLVCNLWRGELK